ncbi:type I restriction-modification system subunit M [Tepidicaulis sp. LMO-SS28]|uniref:type I restriction-modification system subunit M n=1 Tax=Tepidicaulis sp. LMO-SS28 TaxID=3447455 RepID=UPI003EE008D0
MNHTVHNKLISFIWSIADDCLRDVYVRGKYRDVILPMVVLRRLDTLLEETKDAVLEEVDFQKNEMKFTEFDPAGLTKASGYVFYNTSKWTLRSIYDTATNNQQILLQNFEDYLNGFSDNVKEIVAKFDLRAKIRHMAAKDVLLDVLEKFVSPYINLTPYEREDPDGYRLPALSNLGMGYVFEELIRKFNEENNEEAGEHFTPREVIQLMTHLIFDPIKDKLPPVMTIYDPACGSGGMLTEAQNFIKDEEGAIKALGDVYLYGKEINDETYAICKSDMMIKGNDPSNIKSGSTLATDEFAGTRFDFMLSNPPYGKSWSSDLKYIKDGKDVIDTRFQVRLKDYWGKEEVVDATPRSSDGQLLFLMEMISKMKPANAGSMGSRIASVHNGSSIFTGDAGQGESNIRRHIIENDMLEAIIQLPNNLFYNTGITTYIWVLSNNKPAERKGRIQLIEAGQLFRKLRKNLGEKNCEFAPEHVAEITRYYLDFLERDRGATEDGIAAQIFNNEDFGYYKVTIERPDRRKAQFRSDLIEALRYDKSIREPMEWAYAEFGDALYEKGFLKEHEKAILKWCEDQEITLSAKNRSKLLKLDTWKSQASLIDAANVLKSEIGEAEFSDFNQFKQLVDKSLKAHGIKLSASEKNAILNAVSWYDESAEKVVKKKQKLSREKLSEMLSRWGCAEADLSDFGFYPTGTKGEFITYETSTDLRDTENVDLTGDIHSFFREEVKPHIGEAWVDMDSVKIGYEVSFNKHFYRHKSLRSLDEIADDIIALEQQSEGLIANILGLRVEQVSGVRHG